MNEHVFDASCTLATRPKWHWIIVAYFHDASKMYRTRHLIRLLYFNVILDASCKFSTRRNDIYDPSARIINNPLNSTIFWTRHLNSATRRFNSATRQILQWNIVVYFGDASSQLGDASAQLRDASKMQLWPQWLTIPHGSLLYTGRYSVPYQSDGPPHGSLLYAVRYSVPYQSDGPPHGSLLYTIRYSVLH